MFLVDHGILSGIQTNVINGKRQFSAAPMTLLYQSSGAGPLLPIAIQVCKEAKDGVETAENGGSHWVVDRL